MRWVLSTLLLMAAVFGLGLGSALAEQYPVTTYWRDGQRATAYDFGSRSPLKDGKVAAPASWLLITGRDAQGRPHVVPGQFLIFSAGEHDPAYSDLWQVFFVEVPPSYQPNTFRSADDVRRSGFPQTAGSLFEYPFVDKIDRLAGIADPPRQGWLDGSPVWYYNLGATSATPGTLWKFTASDPKQANPVPLSGQLPVADASPSAFRRVVWLRVPAGYAVNSITTAQQVHSSGFEAVPTDSVVNLAAPPATAPAPQRGPRAAEYGIIAVFSVAFLAGAVYLLRLPRPSGSPVAQ